MATSKKGGVKVGLNGNLPVQKSAGSKGTKSGINPKTTAQNSPKGRVGGGNKSVPRPSKG
jgi:hypothetical protein